MYRRAFTLMELIVVITILGILSTIAFVSFQGYKVTTRDSVRVHDIENISKNLELYKIENGEYPNPSEAKEITYSGGVAWTQGILGSSIIPSLNLFSEVPTDPLTGISYSYSITNKKDEFEIGGILEQKPTSNLSQTYAEESKLYTYIRGDYNGKILKVKTSNTDYILGIPSIIGTDITSTDLLELVAQKKLSYKGFDNLPASFNGEFSNNGSFEFTPANIVAWSGDIKILSTDIAQRAIFIDNLKVIYSGSPIENDHKIVDIINANDSNKDELAIRILELNVRDKDKAKITYNEGGVITIPGNTIPESNPGKISKTCGNVNAAFNSGNGYYNTSDSPNLNAFVALKNDGSLVSWGASGLGGDGYPVDTGYIDIYSNDTSFIGMKSDGSLKPWGAIEGLFVVSPGVSTPTDSGYIKLVSSDGMYVGLKNNGTIYGWGNKVGTSAPTDSGYVDIFSGEGAFAALKADGSISTWGDTRTGASGGPADNGYVKIYSNGGAFAAIKADGSIFAWGSSTSGGTGAPTGSGYVSIYTNFGAFTALKSDGTVVTWGSGIHGGGLQPSGSGYTNIASSTRAFAALKSDGSIATWGTSSYGGSNGPTDNGYIKIYSNFSAFAAIKADGSIFAWGSSTSGGTGEPTNNGYTKIFSSGNAFAALKADGSIFAWGSSTSGGTGAPTDNGYISLHSTSKAFTAVKTDGSVKSWGDSNFGGTGAPTGTGYKLFGCEN